MTTVLAWIGGFVVACLLLAGLAYGFAFASWVWYWRWGKGARAVRHLDPTLTETRKAGR